MRSRLLASLFVILLCFGVSIVEISRCQSDGSDNQTDKEKLVLPTFFRVIVFPMYYLLIVSLAQRLVRGFRIEDVGLNFHLTAFVMNLTCLGLQHPYAQEIALSVFIIVAFPLSLTFVLYMASVKHLEGDWTKYGCLFSGAVFLGISFVWAASYFV